jgi:hypothetical protein
MLRDARDLNEFAFALGALAHYAADNTGHPEAVNKAVPLMFPKLRAKYGDTVTYVQSPAQHVAGGSTCRTPTSIPGNPARTASTRSRTRRTRS